MQIKDILNDVQLGSSVAEFDDRLEDYFVETETFRALVEDRADIISGDKGTGKSALFRVLQKRFGRVPELRDVEIVSGFNHKGSPVFQKLVSGEVLAEGQYTDLWKAYVLSLVGNWVLGIFEGHYTKSMEELDELLQGLGLRSKDDTPQTVFSKLLTTFSKLWPKSAQAEVTLNESGLPVVTPRIEFGVDTKVEPSGKRIVTHVEVLSLLNRVLDETGYHVWITLDRLDEAFQGFPDIEVPALRALFRTYLDLQEFERFKLKIFVRKDLFRRITAGGFVNLTHVNARKVDIIWQEDDLLNLLCRRIRENKAAVRALGIQNLSDQEMFDRLFPKQVDLGEKRPPAWSWMMSRIRDGNDIKPPRNLIDLVSMAREAQLRREGIQPRLVEPEAPIFEGEAIKRALSRLSEQRVQDTLLAEAGSATPLIDLFRDGKAEHNLASLAALLGVDEAKVKEAVKPLIEIGFLEDLGETFKVPMLYREGLELTRGKAF